MARSGVLRSSICLAFGLLLLPGTAAAQARARTETEVLSAHEATELLVSQVKPDYPPIAHANYIQGQVQMEVMIGPDGHVRRAHVLRGHPLLAASALKAIKRWVYRPFITPSGPASFSTQVKVVFDLRDVRRDRDRFPSAPDQDLERQVKPPAVISRSSASASASIRMRVLIGDDGHAIDSTLLSGPLAFFESAQDEVTQWRFQPARWGNLAVPWYLELDVPVDSQGPSRAAVEIPKS